MYLWPGGSTLYGIANCCRERGCTVSIKGDLKRETDRQGMRMRKYTESNKLRKGGGEREE